MSDFSDRTGEALLVKSAGFHLEGSRHAFSTRHGGVPHGGKLKAYLPGFLAAAGFPPDLKAIPLHQVHGDQVHTVQKGDRATQVPEADGAVTSRLDVILLVRTADCVPVLLSDPAAAVVGVIHAGWRGALAGVVARTVEAMASLGASPASTRAAMGPAIGPCCFQVGEEVAHPFARLSPALVKNQGPSLRLDLPGAVGHLLHRAGIPEEGISPVTPCTRCHTDQFYSHRAEQGLTGRLISAISVA